VHIFQKSAKYKSAIYQSHSLDFLNKGSGCEVLQARAPSWYQQPETHHEHF